MGREALATVSFLPSERSVAVAAGSTLMEAIRSAGLPLGSSCRGEGACGWCRVRVLDGGGAGLSPEEPRERELLARLHEKRADTDARDAEPGRESAPAERLACQARVLGSLTITTSYW